MNDETWLRRFRANWISSFILHPSAFILSKAGHDARYFQISVPVQPGTLESKL
jgi:hypothetical protein